MTNRAVLRAAFLVAAIIPGTVALAYSTVCDPKYQGSDTYYSYEARYNPETGRYEGVEVVHTVERWVWDCQYVFGPGPEPYGDSAPIHLDGHVSVEAIDAGDPSSILFYATCWGSTGYEYATLWTSTAYLGETVMSPGTSDFVIGGFPIQYINSGNTVVYLKACTGDDSYCSGTRSYVTRTVRQIDGHATMTAYWPEGDAEGEEAPGLGATAFDHALFQKYVETEFTDYVFQDNTRIGLLAAFAYVEWDSRMDAYWTHWHWVDDSYHRHDMDNRGRTYLGNFRQREERTCPGASFSQSPTVGTEIDNLWINTPAGILRPALVFGSSIELSGL